jgi:patatin-like phospholipase/acyl hydrolase
MTCIICKQALHIVSKNALLSDVCISTSAAPTYLPGHQFETKDKDGKPRAFNLIDGGVAANNPVSHIYFLSPSLKGGHSTCRI